MIYIGIDFGHAETTVSRVPGYNDAPVSQIKLSNPHNETDRKVTTAVCKRNGRWAFVNDYPDYDFEEYRSGFKGMVNCPDNPHLCMSSKDQNSMKVFSKLLFENILAREKLKYDPKNPENRDFKIGVAYPASWSKMYPAAKEEYLEFFRNECEIPVDHCIKESDAALFTRFKYHTEQDNVLVIDIGSDSIEFSTYSDSGYINDCCWTHMLGSQQMDDALLASIMSNGENLSNIKSLNSNQHEAGHCNCNAALALRIRSAKEKYCRRWCQCLDTGEDIGRFQLCLRHEDLTQCDEDPRKVCVEYDISSDEFMGIISNYISRIRQEFQNAKVKLDIKGFTPTRIQLSGSASQLPFIKSYANEIFGVVVDFEADSECTVSHGIALFADAYDKAQMQIIDSLRAQDSGRIYKQAYIAAIKDAVLENYPNLREIITGTNDLSGNEICDKVLNFFMDFDANNISFSKLLNEHLCELVNEMLYPKIKDAFSDAFRLIIRKTEAMVCVHAKPLYFETKLFKETYSKRIHQFLNEATGPHIFDPYDPVRPRFISTRNTIDQRLSFYLTQDNPLSMKFDEHILDIKGNDINNQLTEEINRLFKKNGHLDIWGDRFL